MEQKIITASEAKKMVSTHEEMKRRGVKELNYIMYQIEASKRSGKTRYLVSSIRLKPEYERILMNVGYKVGRGRIITQISW